MSCLDWIGGVAQGIAANAIYSKAARYLASLKSRFVRRRLVPLRSGVLYDVPAKSFACPKCSTPDFPVPMMTASSAVDGVNYTRVECGKCGLTIGIHGNPFTGSVLEQNRLGRS